MSVNRRCLMPGVSARRQGPSNRWNLAMFWMKKLFGGRAAVGGGVVPSPVLVEAPPSVPNEMMKMSRDTWVDKERTSNGLVG